MESAGIGEGAAGGSWCCPPARSPAGHREPLREAELGKGVRAGPPGVSGSLSCLPRRGTSPEPHRCRAGCWAGCRGASAPSILGDWVRARSPVGMHVTSRHPLAGGQHHSPHPTPDPAIPPTPSRGPLPPSAPHLPLRWLRTQRQPPAPSGPRGGGERDRAPAGPGLQGLSSSRRRSPRPDPASPHCPPPGSAEVHFPRSRAFHLCRSRLKFSPSPALPVVCKNPEPSK